MVNIVFQYKITHIKNITYLQIQLLVDMNDILTTPPKQTRSTPLLQTQNEISHPPHPTNCKLPTHTQMQLIVKCFMYNLKMANIDDRNMQLYLINSKRTIRNIVLFLTIYICTINLFLLFDKTTGMTHLKITKFKLIKMDIVNKRMNGL